MFYDYIINYEVDKNNIDKWENQIKKTIKYNFIKIYKIKLNRYGFENFENYINFIKDNITNNNKQNLNNLNRIYKENKLKEDKEEELAEKKRLGLLLFKSIKYHNPNVKIRLLLKKDVNNIYPLYYDFKVNYMNEQITEKDSNDIIDDHILKNQIYGIFENNKLTGIMTCKTKKFIIDNFQEKVNTFYIEEMIVNKNYNGKNYGKLLINYAILICPIDIEYISFMTSNDNIAMHKIGKRFDFIKQELDSGDPLNPALFIRINNVIDRQIYKNLNYLKSLSDISK